MVLILTRILFLLLHVAQDVDEELEQEAEVQAAPEVVPVAEPRSRSRSQEREPDSPASGSSINSGRYRSDVLPPTPPAAQRDRISRDVYDHMGIVGQFRAVPDALVDDVITDMERNLHTSLPIRYYPGHAQLWHEVTSVVLPTPYVIEGELALDLRNSRWENYCPIRRVPLLFLWISVPHPMHSKTSYCPGGTKQDSKQSPS